MEILDVVDEKGVPTGQTVERSTAHEKGIKHRTAHVWITRKNNGKVEILLQKRSLEKESFPGCYDTSSAGHIQAGDNPKDSAIRELEEELGVSATKDELEYIGTFEIEYAKEFHGKMFRDSEVPFVYIYSGEVDENKLILQKEEVESVSWFELEKVYKERCITNEVYCVPLGSLELLIEYYKKHETEA